MRGPRHEVDLHPARPPGVLRRHLRSAQTADEGFAPLSVDQPVVPEAEDDGNCAARAFVTTRRPRRHLLVAPAAADVVAQALGRRTLK